MHKLTLYRNLDKAQTFDITGPTPDAVLDKLEKLILTGDEDGLCVGNPAAWDDNQDEDAPRHPFAFSTWFSATDGTWEIHQWHRGESVEWDWGLTLSELTVKFLALCENHIKRG